MSKISGVYGIYGPNMRVYIGSSDNIRKRWHEHYQFLLGNRRKGWHHSIFLQRAWDKYSETAFTWKIIIQVQPIEEQLLAAENTIMQWYKHNGYTLYNSSPIAGTTRGMKNPYVVKIHGIKIKLPDGTEFASQTDFAKYLGCTPGNISVMLASGHTPEQLLNRPKRGALKQLASICGISQSAISQHKAAGKSLDEIARTHKFGDARKSRTIINLSNGKIFINIIEFAKYVDMHPVSVSRIIRSKKETYEQIAQRRGRL